MKRFVVILLFVSILLGLSGCEDRFDIQQVGSINLDDTLNYNYNNAIAGNSKFWIADRSVYYAYNALIYGGYVRSSSDGREKILSFWLINLACATAKISLMDLRNTEAFVFSAFVASV